MPESTHHWRMTVPGCLLALLGVLLCAGGALAATEAGRVISLAPEAWAERDGARLELALKTALLVRDVVQTDVVGRAQILFTDDTTVSVAPNTRVSLSDFVFDEGGRDSFALHVASGVSRVVTGLIVKNNPDGFRVTTPHATVGIRGTDLTIVSGTEQTRVIISQVGPAGLVVTNRATGQSTLHQASNITVEVGPRGTVEHPSTPGEGALGRAVSRSNTNQNLVAGSDAPLLNTLAVPATNSGDNPVNTPHLYTPATLSGHFSGNLASRAMGAIGDLPATTLGGVYSFDVALGSGRVSNASARVRNAGNPVFSGDAGSGAISANGLTFTAGGWTSSTWNTAAGSLGAALSRLNAAVTLNGQFNAATGQLYDNVTAGFAYDAFTPQTLFGTFSGRVTRAFAMPDGSDSGVYNVSLTGAYRFAVDTGNGRVRDVALTITSPDTWTNGVSTPNNVIWAGTGGSGSIAAGTLAFTTAPNPATGDTWTNSPSWDTNASNAARLLSDSIPQLQGAFDAATGQPMGVTFSVYYSRADIGGSFSGRLDPDSGSGRYSFDVALGSGRLSNAGFTLDANSFGGGSGAIQNDLTFLVNNFTTKPGGLNGELAGAFDKYTGQPASVRAVTTLSGS